MIGRSIEVEMQKASVKKFEFTLIHHGRFIMNDRGLGKKELLKGELITNVGGRR